MADPVNQPHADESMSAFHARIVGEYPVEKIDAAVAFLKTQLEPSDIPKMQAEMDADPDGWIVPYHFYFGMHIRNRLRQAGFGEAFWPIWNLDDLYVPLLERAVRGLAA